MKLESKLISNDLDFFKNFKFYAKKIDDKATRVAQSSFYNYDRTYEYIDKMFDLLDKKKNYVIRYAVISETLKRLSEQSRTMLIDYFYKRKGYDAIAEKLGLSTRTCSRKICELTKSYSLEKSFVEKEINSIKNK